MDQEKQYSVLVPVRWGDIDGNGHLANSKYLEYATHARFQFMSDHGICPAGEQSHSCGPVLFSDFIEYQKEIRFNANITVTLALIAARRDGSRWQFSQDVLNGGQVAATIIAKGGWLSLTERRLIIPPREMTEVILQMPRHEKFQWLD